jgi:hypothetical protein
MLNQQHMTSKTAICIDGIEIEVDAEATAQIVEGKARVARMAAERLAKGQYRDYLGLFSSEDRLGQLQLIAPNIPEADFWSCLAYAWVSTHETSINTWDWLRLFRRPRLGRHQLMTHREQTALAAMPDVLTMYCGARPWLRYGLCWTIEKARKEWFANRCGGRVYTATLRKPSVIAYLSDHRSENEIVADSHIDLDAVGLVLLSQLERPVIPNKHRLQPAVLHDLFDDQSLTPRSLLGFQQIRERAVNCRKCPKLFEQRVTALSPESVASAVQFLWVSERGRVVWVSHMRPSDVGGYY